LLGHEARNGEEKLMTPGATTLLAIVIFTFAALCVGLTFGGCYLAWFQPKRLRQIEIRIIRISPFALSKEQSIKETESALWLTARRLTTTAGSLAFVVVGALLFYQLVIR
jgi:hypothetical protein